MEPILTSDDTIIVLSVSGAVVALVFAAGVLHWLRKRYITLGNRVTKVDEEQADGVDTQVVMLPPRFETACDSPPPRASSADAGHFLTCRSGAGAALPKGGVTNRNSVSHPNNCAATKRATGHFAPLTSIAVVSSSSPDSPTRVRGS
ncbi:hypothetical protein HDU81_000270 [Chytriomyces hyalinus]|nr:hypothetical protein HDU81_000270 [Chytriomyces hyalinus]